REGACLQGFPRAFEFEGTLDPCFRQLGNSVPPPFAASLAAHVLGEILGPPAASDAPGIVKSVGPSFSRLIPALKKQRRHLHSL
ncbi:MAG TPA: DNA cytosine methyltransferase, partial [Conexibacter sp.]